MIEFYQPYNPETSLEFIPLTRSRKLPNGVNLHYKEAGSPENPCILLLHGLPSSSHYFKDIIPALASSRLNFHVIAPDLPGFGATQTPANFKFTFEKISHTLILFLNSVSIQNFSLFCVGEYGALVGFKLMPFKQDKITSLIIQNGSLFYDTRTNVDLLDLFDIQPKTPMEETSAQSLQPPSILKSCVKSRHNSITPSDSEDAESDLSSLPISRATSHVSFSGVINEYKLDGSNHLSITKTFSPTLASTAVSPTSAPDSKLDSKKPSYLDLTLASDNSPPQTAFYNHSNESFGSNFENEEAIFVPTKEPTMPSLETFKNLYTPYSKKDLISSHPSSLFGDNDYSDTSILDPLTYLLDWTVMTQTNGSMSCQIQSALYLDYLKNRANDRKLSVWLRTTEIPFLVIWGTDDPVSAGNEESICESYRRDVRNCKVEMIPKAGHFAVQIAPRQIIHILQKYFNKSSDDD